MTLAKPSVVVVDDEEHILKTMGICLESAGFDVSLFRDPGQAARPSRTGISTLPSST